MVTDKRSEKRMTHKKAKNYLQKRGFYERILHGEVTEQERDAFLGDFDRHIETPYGTFENYPLRYIMEAIAKEYPELVDLDYVRCHSKQKVFALMERFWNLAMNNQKINTPPAIIQMLVNHANGKEELSSMVASTVVVENNFVVGNLGQCPAPEEKNVTIN
jgi:hypothetical protein